jgi:preprotein translocase subunit SecE
MTYLRDVRSEMKRVVWPGRPEVINSSVVVVTTLIFFIVFIAITDLIVIRIVGFIQGLGG